MDIREPTHPGRPAAAPQDIRFGEVLDLIQQARKRAAQSVNTHLIELYWQVGALISRKLALAEWGTSVVAQLADYLARTQPGLRGFTRSNLFKMCQFYETYQGDIKVSTLWRLLSWSHHRLILSQCKSAHEREFYMKLTVQEHWSVRELERRMNGALFERHTLNPPQASLVASKTYPDALAIFRDSYLLEFLDLPANHHEADLHKSLLLHLKDFLCELGRDFCFVGTEYPLQVGSRDFALDLLCFHRGLNCLVAVELKVGRFEPEYLGKLNFYLEALDRDVRKPHENPSLGVLLCASKDEEVVEYALNRSLSPALIAEYQTRLPDKRLLQAKLQELMTFSTRAEEAD
jgi:predicted nuclease of restriction endonuclease-like (RecB) superfamily